MKGLSVIVYRPAGYPDCSLGGLSSGHDTLVLVGPGIPELTEVTAERPGVRLVEADGYRYAIPALAAGSGQGGWAAGGNYIWAFGGNFVSATDSRFPARYPIPVHDRDLRKER